jgi:glutamate racemase
MKENKQHIGIFDSGLGGLTVLKALKQTLPNESFIYFGDTEHLPYGNKSQKSIVEYSLNIAKFLYKKNIKAIVVACNTASAVALEPLKQKYSIPVLNVIDPSITRAVNLSSAQTIGVIGTETTILSQAYQKKYKIKIPRRKCFQKPVPCLSLLLKKVL